MLVNILTVGIIGSVIFTFFVIFMAYSGIASEMRDEEGNFKKTRNWKSFLGGIIFIVFLFGLLFYGNQQFIDSLLEKPKYLELFLNALGIFFVVHIYDLVVLDYLVVVKWHPKFLNLPDTDYYRTMKPHIQGFIRGILIGILASLVISLISYLLN